MWGPIGDVRPGASRAAPSLIQPPPEQPDLLTLTGKHREQPALRCQHSHWRCAGGLLLLCACVQASVLLCTFILPLFQTCRLTLTHQLDAP